jgi:hypothetical protein
MRRRGTPGRAIRREAALPRDRRPRRSAMATEHSSESVTEDQDGQFSTVSETIPMTVVKAGPEKHPVEASELLRRDAGDIAGNVVTMERSGAERVEGERVSMTNSGARTLSARSLQMQNSGTVTASAERIVLQSSSAIVASAEQMRLSRSRAVFANAGEMTAEQDVAFVNLNTDSVKAAGDVRATFLVAGDVAAEGDVRVTFDATSAFALGAGIATVLLVVRGLLRKMF